MGRRPERQRGQALVELALVLPVLLLVALALLQFGLYAHGEDVVTAACQDGARTAAEDGRSLGDGVAVARALLQAGLGAEAGGVSVEAQGDATAVALEARGSLPLLLPVFDASLPLHARAVMLRG